MKAVKILWWAAAAAVFGFVPFLIGCALRGKIIALSEYFANYF